MKTIEDGNVEEVLAWCTSILGPIEVLSDDTREHPGQRASNLRLRTARGNCYVKLHRNPSHWDSEVHGYEQWSAAFGAFTSKLLAVRDEAPLAVVINELPGKLLDEVELTSKQACAVWRSAGNALAAFHDQAVGDYFGPCHRDGSCIGPYIPDARAYVRFDFNHWLEIGKPCEFLTGEELTVVNAAIERLPVFAGERPVPCHRDYGPANWLVTPDGVWTGVIDYEFSHWDVRTADFARYPNWEWIDRPELIDAFFDGYGRTFTPDEDQQILVAKVLYALGAVVWGMENSYFGFAAEGRRALHSLEKRLK